MKSASFCYFQQWMENQDCDEASVYPCCSQTTFPYKQEVFELCIKRAIMELDRSTSYHLDSMTPGPRFDINDTIRAIVLEFQSTYLFTLAYEKMYQFYREVRLIGFNFLVFITVHYFSVAFRRLLPQIILGFCFSLSVLGGHLDQRGASQCSGWP